MVDETVSLQESSSATSKRTPTFLFFFFVHTRYWLVWSRFWSCSWWFKICKPFGVSPLPTPLQPLELALTLSTSPNPWWQTLPSLERKKLFPVVCLRLSSTHDSFLLFFFSLSWHYYCWIFDPNNPGEFQKVVCDDIQGPDMFFQRTIDMKRLGGAAFLTEWGGTFPCHWPLHSDLMVHLGHSAW